MKFIRIAFLMIIHAMTILAIQKTSTLTANANEFFANGVTAHRGNSCQFPENTLPAFQSGIDVGADWIELDLFRTRDGKLVVIHDRSTKRTGDKDLDVIESTYEELLTIDVATDFRMRTGKSLEDCPAERIPLLEDVLRLVMGQNRTRVSIQPKMDCVDDAVLLVKRLKAEPWVGFNDGNLAFMARVKELAPEIKVFWDRPANSKIDADIAIAKQHRFESLVIHQDGITAETIAKIKDAGIEVGSWTVNDPERMTRLIGLGVERFYTDYPRVLLALKHWHHQPKVACEGVYPHHLQGICADEDSIYWSFTTALVKTDLQGNKIQQIPVVNHHGDLCHHNGKLFVAVNLGKFNDPQGNADSWIYVYDSATLKETARHEVQQVFHGAGGVGYRNGRFYVVGGLPEGIQENYVYEYDADFRFIKRHEVASGHTHLGIQTAAFALDRWWFGCYGSPEILLVTDADFRMIGRYSFNCSLGIESLPNGKLLVASGRCDKPVGCNGNVQAAAPDTERGLVVLDGRTDR